jgi:hypothetical protein
MANQEIEDLKARVAALERELAAAKAGKLDPKLAQLAGAAQNWLTRRSVRIRSDIFIGPWPLYEIAKGPDLATGEIWGHARAIFAYGDIATGFLAIGGVARGIIAVGGLAVGLFSFGGLAVGLGLAFGGLACGFVAIGGVGIGAIAAGGLAVGYFAVGGGAIGMHVIEPMNRDPAAIQFFAKWIPGLNQLFPQAPPQMPPQMPRQMPQRLGRPGKN